MKVIGRCTVDSCWRSGKLHIVEFVYTRIQAWRSPKLYGNEHSAAVTPPQSADKEDLASGRRIRMKTSPAPLFPKIRIISSPFRVYAVLVLLFGPKLVTARRHGRRWQCPLAGRCAGRTRSPGLDVRSVNVAMSR